MQTDFYLLLSVAPTVSIYLETQLAVYRHLLARHEQDPAFRFKVRQQDFLGNGLFIGKEFPAGNVKPYFSFTCWQITSGSQGDVLAYVIETTKTGGFPLTVCLDLHPLPKGNEQDARNRDLTEAVRAQIPGAWKRDAPYGQLHMPAANTTSELLTALDALLDQTKKPLDKLVQQLKAEHPDWEGGPVTVVKFRSVIGNLGQWRRTLLNGDFASVAREHKLKKLPTLWSSGMKPAIWKKVQTAGTLAFSSEPKSLPKAKMGDLIVATDSSSDRRAYGFGRILTPVTGGALAVEWLVTTGVELAENTYATSVFSKSSKLDQTLAAFEVVQPGLLEMLLHGKKDAEPIDAEIDAEDLIEHNEVVTTKPPYTTATARAEGIFLPETALTEIVGALKLKQNIILKGPPGVGKTFVARKLAYLLFEEEDDDRVELTQFHQSVSYEDFVRGWRPGGAHGALTIADGPLVRFAEKARDDQEGRPYVLIIDEINRGNLSKVFGELFMLLEADKREAKYGVRLTYPNPEKADEKFFLPPNLYLIGTMNTADRSLALVDYALRRRFRFFELRPHLDDALGNWLRDQHGADPAALLPCLAVVEELNEQISDPKKEPLLGPGFAVGHSYFCPAKGQQIPDVAAWFGAIVRHELLPLLEEYWDGDPKGAGKLKDWEKQLLTAAGALAPPPQAEASAPDTPAAS